MTEARSVRPLTDSDIARYKANLRDEVDGAALYRLLAEAEQDESLRTVLTRLAESEERHRDIWERRLREANVDVPEYRPSRRVRLLGWVARRFGTSAVAPIVARMETAATTMYDDQPEAVEAGLPREERSHARIFREIGRSTARPDVGVIGRVERRHRGASANALRAAVLGVNDGLVSNLILVMGVAGANPGRDVVVLAGLTGLLAGAFSMALGEWISVRSSAEAYQRQVAIERDELEIMPEEEQEELALIYQAKGFTRDEAERVAARIFQDREVALDTLVREEIGVDDGGNPWVAAITSFVLFTLGAVVPIAPWFVAGGVAATTASAIAAGLALFGAGAVTTFFTGRNVLFSGSRMLLFGLAGAAVTFGIGRIVGVSVGL